MSDSTEYIQKQIDDLDKKINESKNLLESSTDESLKELAKEDMSMLESQKIQLGNSIKTIRGEFVEKTADSKAESVKGDAIVEIRAGTGGNEAGLFANDLFTMYTKFANRVGFSVASISKNEGGIGNIKEVVFQISGKSQKGDTPYSLLQHEIGVHRVQRVPITESSGRIHTSTATVAVLPVVDKNINIEIRPEDLKTDTYRSSGAGGQHVNKTESAIRITHIPTGVVVACQEERSQHKNRERAMGVLKAKLYDMMQTQQKDSIDDLRTEQVGTGERSEKIRTYNFPQDRITDHRIKQSWHNMEKFMEGYIDDMLNSLRILEVSQ